MEILEHIQINILRIARQSHHSDTNWTNPIRKDPYRFVGQAYSQFLPNQTVGLSNLSAVLKSNRIQIKHLEKFQSSFASPKKKTKSEFVHVQTIEL